MANLNVYVPEDLKRRMDKVKNPPVWSQVACEAFERKLGELAAQKKDKAMADVIQRLRASKLKSGSEEKQRGRRAGREWAMHRAEAPELQRLSMYYAKLGGLGVASCEEAFIAQHEHDLPGARRFVATIDPDEEDNRVVEEFWFNEGFDRGLPTDEFVQGFTEGALEVWDEVEGEL